MTNQPENHTSPSLSPLIGPGPYSIGQVAKSTGIAVETVRYYERIGLLPAPPRGGGNYRRYGMGHVERLQFIRRARALGFALEDIKTLLGLAKLEPRKKGANQPLASPSLDKEVERADVHKLAKKHLQEVEDKLAQLQRLRTALRKLIAACPHGEVSGCGIIDGLTGVATKKQENTSAS
ncbi:helix-turn-helix domain-containing protein [Formicincola oecophyllae]|uniref:Helix-turn-helix domain-containing protein n=1 Tax=Formicincola oecophyllae TaxID=2558361 RepID=A0A4Y6UA79_9PROT|nr:helix-turn-helix domain-containing protein [Formicincola oecophyllae]QDH13281.1 helix-turn-helix domain-containing protein [Formicincola oecophyllae]